MTAYRNFTTLVNEDIIGIRSRTRGRESRYYRHPLVRNDWGTADHFRGVQGYYFAKGSYRQSPRLFNFSRHPYWSTKTKRPFKLAGGGRFTESSFTIYFDDKNWNLANRHKRKVMNNYLAQQSTDVLTGEPNFYQYVAGDLGVTKYYKSYYMKKWKKLARFRPAIQLDTDYIDHHSLYDFPSSDKKVLAKSSYNLAVNSYYNFYLDTYPPYEDAVAGAGLGVEVLLPNLYMLESDIHNTASVNYLEQLTLGNDENFYDGPELDVWFLEQNQTSAEGNKAYFQQFSETLDILNAQGAIEGTKKVFEEKFKNVAILFPDLDILKKYNIRDDRGTPNDTSDDIKATAFYPFYNEIIIGFDKKDIIGLPEKRVDMSFFTTLFASKLDADEVRSFLVFLQLYIIENLNLGRTTPTDFQAFTRETISPDGKVRDTVESYKTITSFVFDMEDFIAALRSGALTYLLDVYNESREEMADDANYTILREWENEELFELSLEEAIKVTESPEFEKAVDDRRRSLQQVFGNLAGPSETVMYLIDKRLNPRGPNNDGPIIQTIMVSKDVVYSDLLRYVDTQVAYGVRYKYEIRQVRMLFGNKYSYDGASFDFGELKIGQGRAVGNALGFYPPVDEMSISINGSSPEEEYSYLTSDEEQRASTTQSGHFIFRVPKETGAALAANGTLPPTATTAGGSPLGKYYTAVQRETADFSGFVVELHDGYGVEGALDGGMTGLNLEIPDEVLTLTNSQLAPDSDEEAEEYNNPMAMYKRAIDIAVGGTAATESELDATMNEIIGSFKRMIEEGDQQKVNSLLIKMRRIRDKFIKSVAGAPGGVLRDERTDAAGRIYKRLEPKVRALLAETKEEMADKETKETKNDLFHQLLGPAQKIEPHSTVTSFKGLKGTRGLNLRFR